MGLFMGICPPRLTTSLAFQCAAQSGHCIGLLPQTQAQGMKCYGMRICMALCLAGLRLVCKPRPCDMKLKCTVRHFQGSCRWHWSDLDCSTDAHCADCQQSNERSLTDGFQ